MDLQDFKISATLLPCKLNTHWFSAPTKKAALFRLLLKNSKKCRGSVVGYTEGNLKN